MSKKTIALQLKDFPSLPHSLAGQVTSSGAATFAGGTTVRLKDLAHHYYLAKYDQVRTRCGGFEYAQFLAPGTDWRFTGSGIGADKESKRNASNELGKAFARWFLYEHCGQTFFAPFETERHRKRADGSKWTVKGPGDLPDYVCGPNRKNVGVLEAKGRYSSVGFKTKEFDEFRKQVGRVELTNAAGKPLSVKGYISAARWATEDHPQVKSTLMVEDPRTSGEPPTTDDLFGMVGISMIATHYAEVFDRLQLPVHALALRSGEPMEARVPVRRFIWRGRLGAVRDRKFVGGILPDATREPLSWFDLSESRYLLSAPRTFFGVDVQVFQWARHLATLDLRDDPRADQRAGEPAPLERATRALRPDEGDLDVPDEEGPPDDPVSLHRDGTVMGPMDFFEPIQELVA